MSIDVYPESVLNAQLWNGQSMPLSIAGGGTGATTAALARTNLGLGTMAEQNANAVAITDGSIALGGASIGQAQLNVRGNTSGGVCIRTWPHAFETGATVRGLYVDAATVSGVGTVANVVGVGVANQLTVSGVVYGIESSIAAGTNRYNIYAGGTAPNYFAGNVGINRMPDNNRLVINYDRATSSAIMFYPNADSGAGAVSYFHNAAAVSVGSIFTNATTTTYNTSSDARLKHAVQLLTDALARIQALKPIEFLWKSDQSRGVGFLAHELQQVIPEAVTGEPDALNDDGSINPQQVDLSKLVPWLVGAVQELSARLTVIEEALA